MSAKQEVLKNLPAVDKLLQSSEVGRLVARHGKDAILFCIRQALVFFRNHIQSGHPPPSSGDIFREIDRLAGIFFERSLRKVFNATGIIIHTNLGRSPFSGDFLNDNFKVLNGYNNLEFDLKKGSRGSRNDHASEILKYLTGAEDVLVVNNDAAAVMLVLSAFAKKKEVVVSRGELIEIGGSFRLPEIMKASGCKMVEVGTTNKTKPDDFRNAIAPKTALLFKAHKSNYFIKGFTQEVDINQLSKLGKEFGIPVLFDLGSGLLRKNLHPLFAGEPTVSEAVSNGVDLVCFSGDKLMGGPQAGIIAGKKELIMKLKKEPVLRALRVCKTTLALLETTCSYYLDEKKLKERNHIYRIIHRKPDDIKQAATLLKDRLISHNVNARVEPGKGCFGGGALPDSEIDSFAVGIVNDKPNKIRSAYAERMYRALMLHNPPVLSILKKGNLCFDVLTLFDEDMDEMAGIITETHRMIIGQMNLQPE
ncbi:MAG: L-seryl-tRNA(Sec) selenium transferase [Bacteroidales bacterium]|nr:L-seryl-tRNA(Sec) selenium transferase [Bacteroidales bacterium]